ncbi:MAG: hypothetical protein AAFV88_13540 [Planctomycetota bacterium]
MENCQHALMGTAPLHAYVGTVKLSADGLWMLQKTDQQETLREVYLQPRESMQLRRLGSRMYAALEERQTNSERWRVRSGYELCRRFAQNNGGLGPATIDQLYEDSPEASQWGSSNYRIRELRDQFDDSDQGPFIHLVPNVPFKFAAIDPDSATPETSQRRFVPTADRTVLAFQLRPFVNDGKHWVLFTDGNCERVEIDEDLLRDQQAEVKPITPRGYSSDTAPSPEMEYQLVLISAKPLAKSLSLTAYNQVLDETQTIHLATPEEPSVEWKSVQEPIERARKFAYLPYLKAGGGGVLNAWENSGVPAGRANRRSQLSMFSVLGGRAAIEETLQLQDLIVRKGDDDATVEVDTIKGVEVTSHPFEEMLGDRPGGELELARYVPADRFFVYVGKPETLPALFDTGAPFIANLGTALTGNCLKYNLESRYLSRLGMSRDWIDTVLTSGMTSELAVFAPDLFFIDGTDVTVIAKLRQPELLGKLFSMLGGVGLESGAVIEIPTPSGSPAYFALRGELLFASTGRGELEKSLRLEEEDGIGSLGESTEFRYMLTKLDVSEKTRLYAYLSDPFIRRLTSPAVKIGQRRRVLEKARMEAFTARHLMARLNGISLEAPPSQLEDEDYHPKHWNREGLEINEIGAVSSGRYGSLERMHSLPEVPLQKVTPAEAEAYDAYRDNYSRYWRRFFDPIAIRLNDVGDRELELSTFILPLIDNSIYNGLREIMAHQDDQTPLLVPVVEPAPVLQFSANLREDAWRMLAGNFSNFFERYSGASPAMMDDFGPSVHVAIFDDDPIIAMGSGDLFGSFGGDLMRGGGNQMMMLPVALSMLTRPCSIMVETRSPERTAQYLRQAALSGAGTARRSSGFATSFYQVEDNDEWVWNMNVFGVVKLRYGIEVVDKYMVIRNIPWSSDDRVVSLSEAPLNAAVLQANPGACEKQLPGLFAAASDGNRRATLSGMGRLYPLMLCGADSVPEAAEQHRKLFGFYPTELPGDRWIWADNRLISEQYGEPLRQKQPAFDPSRPFGLFSRIDSLKLNMQFEDDGLRSSVRWRLR